MTRDDKLRKLQAEYSEAAEVCAEAYQVVGSLLSDVGMFGTEQGDKILDNLLACRMVHKDVLPWPAFPPKVAPMSAGAKHAVEEMDADLGLPLNRPPVAISRPWCRELRAWIRQVTGE